MKTVGVVVLVLFVCFVIWFVLVQAVAFVNSPSTVYVCSGPSKNILDNAVYDGYVWNPSGVIWEHQPKLFLRDARLSNTIPGRGFYKMKLANGNYIIESSPTEAPIGLPDVPCKL